MLSIINEVVSRPEFIVPAVLIPFFLYVFLFAVPEGNVTEDFWEEEIETASCGELKDWILNREVPIFRDLNERAIYEFTWRCEK